MIAKPLRYCANACSRSPCAFKMPATLFKLTDRLRCQSRFLGSLAANCCATMWPIW